MRDSIRQAFSQGKARWKAKEPLVFKKVINLCMAVSGTAIAIHAALESSGAVEPAWWTEIYPYLVGVPAGAATVAKFTRTYDNTDTESK